MVGQPVGHGGEIGHRIGHAQIFGLGAVDRIAKAPAAHRFPAMAVMAAALRMKTAHRCIGCAGRRDRAGDHPLAFGKALDRRAELFDDADRFMTDGQAAGHRIFAFENMDIGAADGGGGDPDQRVERAYIGNRFLTEYDLAGLDEYGGFHVVFHCGAPS